MSPPTLSRRIHVHVFEPRYTPPPSATQTSSPPGSPQKTEQLLLASEFGKDDAIADLARRLAANGYEVAVHETTLANYASHVADIAKLQLASGSTTQHVVFNTCDGLETDGYPGIGVVRALQSARLAYTGADAFFFDVTTSKPDLKKLLVEHKVPTSPYVVVGDDPAGDIKEAERLFGFPMIIKPSVSYASLSITDKSVVHTPETALAQVRRVQEETSDGIFIEKYFAGREFTALCAGDSRYGVSVYVVAERVFNSRLDKFQRLLAFDRYWDGYALDGSKPAAEKEVLYWYAAAPQEWQVPLQKIARDAYVACGGSGYGRVDIRTDSMDKLDAQVLEVNANCGLTFDPEGSSLGQILKLSKESPENFSKSLVEYAIWRQGHHQQQQ